MSTASFTLSTSWVKIFDITLSGYFGIYIEEKAENFNKGSFLFLENGNINRGYETTILNTRGISLVNYHNKNLPSEFQFEGDTKRYEIRKNNSFIEIRIISGTNILITFTLFSAYPDKNLIFVPRTSNSKSSTLLRLGTYDFPVAKYASAKCVSWMDNTATSYTVKLFDKTNNVTLLTADLTNTNEGVQNLGQLTNLPTTNIQIEMTIKRNGGNSQTAIYLESLTIYYN